jgi:gamma-glutamylcyclotransferase (GGCT)/AIG2-like uncharacterized protein YtfP
MRRHLIFTYGTLMRGQYNHYLLGQLPCVGEAEVLGTLYTMGGYPALRTERGLPAGPVRGEVYAVDTATLERLDNLELPYGYSRAVLPAHLLNTGRELSPYVYIYQHPLPEDRIISSGDWKRYATEELAAR